MKLWQKENTSVSGLIERFTVGRDKEFDIMLAAYDVQGSIAHVKMLGTVGLMSAEESNKAVAALEQLLKEIQDGQFTISEQVEDVHSQVEMMLTERIGETGKKIHSGRSRNDQVAVDIKLYLRAEIKKIKEEAKTLFDLLVRQSEKHKDKLLPGYTHLQIAMPSSFGLWLGAYAESLVDDLELLSAAYTIVNKNPLGSGAGYGSSFPLNRTLTTELLGFGTLNHNAVYAQMSRGKTEKIVSMGLSSIAATLSRLSMDCCLYMNQNFGFISFPPHLTTGSSIMPHKKNPDVFELIRARCNRIQSIPNELTLLINNLPSGYHRDLQLTKEILFPAIEELKACLQLMCVMLSEMQANDRILEDEKYKYLFSVEAVNELVNQGIPFREAYKQVGDSIEAGRFRFDHTKPLHHTHEGSLGNLSNDKIVQEMEKVLRKFEKPGFKTTMHPFLTVKNAGQAVEFYIKGLGASLLVRDEGPEGRLMAKLAIEGYEFWLGDEEAEFGNNSPEAIGGSPVRLILTVSDPDVIFSSALNAGATQICPVTTEESWRIGKLKDPFGHVWEIGRPLNE